MKIDELPKEIPLGNAKDLSNMKFGKLTPIYRTENVITGEQQKTMWVCKCDCGEYSVTSANNLTSGHVISCGCSKADDITGQTFGHLTALYPTQERQAATSVVWYCSCDCGGHVLATVKNLRNGDRSKCDDHYDNLLIGKQIGELIVLDKIGKKHGKSLYKCICSCGNYTEVTIDKLIAEDIKTCGAYHNRIEDLTGQVFGKLTVIGKDHNRDKNGRVQWVCECECGNIVSKCRYSLITHNTQSCGICSNKSIGEYNISKILTENGKPFFRQMKFDTCRNPKTNALLPYDFYVVVSDPFLLEFDGPQHDISTYDKNSFFNYDEIHEHDVLKNLWALENEIPMKRIPYIYRDNMTFDDIMSDKFLITPETHPEWYK